MQKRHFIFQAGAGYIISITKLNHVSVLCLSCLMLDQAPSHIIQTLSTCKIFACFLEWAAGADICTLWNLCGIYTGFEHIHSPWSCGASCWSSFDGWTDGRTDVKKDAFFFFKSFWFGQVQTGRIFPYFGRIFPYFRTPSGRPSTKKGTFEGKKAFACLRYMGKSSKDNSSPKLSSAPVCSQLSVETDPHSCNNQRAKHVQKSKQGRSKPWHQTRKREPILWKSLLLHLQAAKTKVAPARMSCKLAMWHIYLISTVSAAWVNVINMQKTSPWLNFCIGGGVYPHVIIHQFGKPEEM